jgi:hypothetical protein
MALNSFSAMREFRKLFANATVTISITTTALVRITVEIAGLTALLLFRRLTKAEFLNVILHLS